MSDCVWFFLSPEIIRKETIMFFVLKDVMPDLHAHLVNERVESHMYASQWFLTLYTAKFPLPVVFHIVDLYLCEVSLSDFYLSI